MTAGIVAAPDVCSTCQGDTTLVVERRGVDVEVPCPGCSCAICGQTTDTPPECGDCWAAAEAAYERRCDR